MNESKTTVTVVIPASFVEVVFHSAGSAERYLSSVGFVYVDVNGDDYLYSNRSDNRPTARLTIR